MEGGLTVPALCREPRSPGFQPSAPPNPLPPHYPHPGPAPRSPPPGRPPDVLHQGARPLGASVAPWPSGNSAVASLTGPGPRGGIGALSCAALRGRMMGAVRGRWAHARGTAGAASPARGEARGQRRCGH